MEVGVRRVHPAHPCSRMRIAVCASCTKLPLRCGTWRITWAATRGWRSAGMSTRNPGEASKASRKRQARAAVQGLRKTRGCVVMRRNW
jgi:hypothetical protein